MAGSERKRELRRRRHRTLKIAVFKRKSETANEGQKQEIARKLRNLTPGAEQVIVNLGLEG